MDTLLMGSEIEAREAFYAQTYDVSVSDWTGEIDFYLEYAAQATSQGMPVLELACGTGRVALKIARAGHQVVGLDRSAAMLEIARGKSDGVSSVRWVEGDMRSFELEQQFGLVIIPGHSFQNLLISVDQISCLSSIHRHLSAHGRLILHLDHTNVDWLGELMGKKGGVFEPAERFTHPTSGREVHTSRAWWYERSTQTAIVQTVWEELDETRQVVNRVNSGRIRIHCVFPFEMEHMISSAGFYIDTVYGDFAKNEFTDEKEEMICVASKRNNQS